jgi:hypothetical protein
VTLVGVIGTLCLFSCKNKIRLSLGFVIQCGLELEVQVLTVLLGFYLASDGVALTLFDQVEHKDDVVLWSAMASIFVKNGKYREGIDCFRRNAELQCGG